jgi:hypothetical protein
MNIEQFKKLPEQLQNKVLDQHRDWNVSDSHWTEPIIEQFKDRMTGYGLQIDNVWWSGFYSQGDGASCDGSSHRLPQFVEHPDLPNFHKYADIFDLESCSANWRSSGFYSHSGTINFELRDGRCTTADSNTFLERAQEVMVASDTVRLDELIKDLETWMRAQCDQLFSDFEDEYEHQTSDEAILETLDCNGCLQSAVDEAMDKLGMTAEDLQETI